MRVKGLALMTGLMLLSGCKLTQVFEAPVEEANNPEASGLSQVCVFTPDPEVSVEHNCELLHWLRYWTLDGGKPWSERKIMISELGESPIDKFKKILLSQGKETPYQNRLRAQGWINQISPRLTIQMKQLVETLITQPSQEKLEFESALAILTRVNAQQAKTLEEQALKLQEQQLQLEKLLKIEASMMEKRDGINQ